MSNPIDRAIALIEQALKLYDDAELISSSLIRQKAGAEHWNVLHRAAMSCASAMRAAAYMYGDPKPPPAKFALLGDVGAPLQLVELTGQVGDWIRAVPLKGQYGPEKGEMWLTLNESAVTDSMRPTDRIAFLLDSPRDYNGKPPKLEEERRRERHERDLAGDPSEPDEDPRAEAIAHARRQLDRSAK